MIRVLKISCVVLGWTKRSRAAGQTRLKKWRVRRGLRRRGVFEHVDAGLFGKLRGLFFGVHEGAFQRKLINLMFERGFDFCLNTPREPS